MFYIIFSTCGFNDKSAIPTALFALESNQCNDSQPFFWFSYHLKAHYMLYCMIFSFFMLKIILKKEIYWPYGYVSPNGQRQSQAYRNGVQNLSEMHMEQHIDGPWLRKILELRQYLEKRQSISAFQFVFPGKLLKLKLTKYLYVANGMYSIMTNMSVTANHFSILLMGAFAMSFLVRTTMFRMLANVPNMHTWGKVSIFEFSERFHVIKLEES